MKKLTDKIINVTDNFLNKLGLGMRAKLIIIFLIAKVIPLILLTLIAWRQFIILGRVLSDIAVTDSSEALNASAVENIERLTTDTAKRVADFLYSRDDDIIYLSGMEPTEENYQNFINVNLRRVVENGEWNLAPDGESWIPASPASAEHKGGKSTNPENNDMDGFNYRPAETFESKQIPLYDEITFIDLNGNELVKAVAKDSPKTAYPMDAQKKNVSVRENTYVKAETYFNELKHLKPGEIYVSDVTGAYVGSNYIGRYVPDAVAEAAAERGYEIEYNPEAQAYAGVENPNGQRFEGIIRWATPVLSDSGAIAGYVTFALNHDHIMEFVDHITPMNERYVALPNAIDGNYAFIWDYQCRNICHPRHHSIAGFDPSTGDPQIPWLESSIYDAWQASGVPKWTDFVKGIPVFDNQSRSKKTAPDLTRQGLVGLDGRYLNNAPQCTGWMDLTQEGGSGSFYILWSGVYKLTTAGAIPYYTGNYAPSEANNFSKRGFGFVAIGAGLDDFTHPARETGKRLTEAIDENLASTTIQLVAITAILIIIVVFIAILLASSLTSSITNLINGITRFRAGERHFRFNAPVKDEFGTLADSFDDMADSIVDSVKSPLCITDMNRKIIYMNDYALALAEKTLDEVVGTLYSESSIYHGASEHCPITAFEEHREAEIYFVEETGRYIRGAADYLLNKENEKIGYICISIDVTDMVREQHTLAKAVNEANKANRHKGEFLARMSHEIRTPMNAIIGVTNIVQKKINEIGSAEQEIKGVKDYLDQIEVSSQHLLGLLNDILDLSKIEAGKIELTKESMDILRLANAVDDIIRPRCEEKNIQFITSFEKFSPPTFLSDPLRLRQVLINLLGNAVKFTPELGSIEFYIKKKEHVEGEVLVEFTVRDNGIGISQDMIDTIFQPFEQADGGISRQYGGTGLGLSISRRIVELFGGEITVTSEPGKGSEFKFSIWFEELGEDDSADVEFEDVTGKFVGKRALLVDDVDINRTIAVAMMEDTGIEMDEAEDGLKALKMFEESSENTYDIIFMDVQMPNMDGYEAARAIRALDRADAKKIPIITLTANAFKEDIDKALASGMNAHVTKPVEMERLLEILFKFLPPDTNPH